MEAAYLLHASFDSLLTLRQVGIISSIDKTHTQKKTELKKNKNSTNTTLILYNKEDLLFLK